MRLKDLPRAYDLFQQAVYRESRSPQLWMAISILYYEIQQYRDSLDAISRVLRVSWFFHLAWYNLGVLVCTMLCTLVSNADRGIQYDASTNDVDDALDAFERCLELKPDQPDVQARLGVLKQFPLGTPKTNIPDDHRIKIMRRCDLHFTVAEADDIGGAGIIFKPIDNPQESSTFS
jgi:tetratricopeptide (TPR) repeat protein